MRALLVSRRAEAMPPDGAEPRRAAVDAVVRIAKTLVKIRNLERTLVRTARDPANTNHP